MCEHIEYLVHEIKTINSLMFQKKCGECRKCFIIILPQKIIISISLANMLKNTDTIIPFI